ncbi:MAG: hypothetical protein JSR82_24335 [Verrucomicrobia bacterium]|nr:hypothetical protein [Verrucomicrobiota bacterium]
MWAKLLADWRMRRAQSALQRQIQKTERVTASMRALQAREERKRRFRRNLRLVLWSIVLAPIAALALLFGLLLYGTRNLPQPVDNGRIPSLPEEPRQRLTEEEVSERKVKAKPKKKSGRVWVSGYTRSNGVRVRGHWRTVR